MTRQQARLTALPTALTIPKEPTVAAIHKVNLGVAEVVEAAVIIEEPKLVITVHQLVVPIAPTLQPQ